MQSHFEAPVDTLWAVVIGAVLATAGGFVATQVEAFMRKREKERSAALMFGEILSALETIIDVAGRSRLQGEPYGSVTMRLVRAALREVETYERNRTMLYDLHDAEIRIKIHVLMVQVGMALTGVWEASTSIAATANPEGADVERLKTEREVAFKFVIDTGGRIKALVIALQPIAKVDFEALRKFSGNPFTN